MHSTLPRGNSSSGYQEQLSTLTQLSVKLAAVHPVEITSAQVANWVLRPVQSIYPLIM